MISKRLVQPSLVALALGAGLAFSASAQTGFQAQPHQQNQLMMQEGQVGPRTAGGLRDWSYNDIYRSGWSAERLLDDAEVIGPLGEEIGNVENIIISDQGQILGIVAEVGGFWDIGDTHVFVPWNQVRVSPTLDRVVIPVTEENVEEYTYGANDILTRGAVTQTQVVDDNLETGPRLWKATDLMDDYAYLRGDVGYGYVNDLIFSTDGTLQALVVNAATAYGGGYRAFPAYGYGYGAGWNPGAANINLGYDETDVVNLAPFEYNRMPGRVMIRNQAEAGGVAQRMDTAANVTGAVPTQWTFRDVDADRNLELTDREFSRVSAGIYDRWDVNRDSRLDADEFYTGYYRVFDTDRDWNISQSEFNTGWNNWGIGEPPVAYNDLDTGRDGIVDQSEFLSGMERVGYYDRWDANRDAALDQNEFNTGMYDVWDADSDGVLAQNEFNDLSERGWF
ncbi:PRC-barrel domain-containing protein [Microvirga roseola]|uniref:PRC-barrel domain-containing protein n=1 Tax=Microvirga roseola TaxID=2883126 RepID=UPI001E3BB3E0|nr:PRC-barrel domain-containing protein [Microvirga roseola]